MKGLGKLFRRFEIMMTAATFAEAGESETAQEIMREEECLREKKNKRANRTYTSQVTANAAKVGR